MPAESGSANFTPSSVLKGDVLKDAAAVRMLVLDVDGVCTDGKLYMDGEGHAVKCFHAHDGIGIKLALRADLGIAVITGRNDPCVRARMTQLGVRHYFPGFEAKMPALRRLAEESGLGFAQMAYLGDDFIDLDPLEVVGMPMAVANARPEVLRAARHVTALKGGEGAVREAVEWLLHARGLNNLAALWRDSAQG